MNLFEELDARGFVENKTSDEIPRILAEERVTCYDGFDPTAPSLHVGNLVGIHTLAHFQRHGHRPIILMGGATGMIGDPSGKSKERVLLTDDKIQENLEAQSEQFRRFMDLDSGAMVVNNADWFGQIGFIDFLRDVGKYFRLGEMMGKESVRSRLESESGISYTEFSYMLLQSYDFLHLFDHHDCRFQVGGSDQWGNITAGIELIRRLRSAPAYGIVTPLITDSSGQKLGKTSEGENVWLDAERTSPYRFYQYWINQPDQDVIRFLKMFTFLTLDEIGGMEEDVRDRPHERAAQKTLAADVTARVHGESGLDAARKATEIMFGGAIDEIEEGTLLDIFADVPSSVLLKSRFDDDWNIVDLLVEAGAAKGKGAARRLIEGGGIYLNNIRVEGAERLIRPEDLIAGTALVLRQGKKNYRLVRFQ